MASSTFFACCNFCSSRSSFFSSSRMSLTFVSCLVILSRRTCTGVFFPHGLRPPWAWAASASRSGPAAAVLPSAGSFCFRSGLIQSFLLYSVFNVLICHGSLVTGARRSRGQTAIGQCRRNGRDPRGRQKPRGPGCTLPREEGPPLPEVGRVRIPPLAKRLSL